MAPTSEASRTTRSATPAGTAPGITQRPATASPYVRPADRPRTLRFDAVEVAMPPAGDRRAPEVRHFENAPLFAKHFRAAD